MSQKALNTISGLYAAARVSNPELRAVADCLFDRTISLEVVLFLERPPEVPTPTATGRKLRQNNQQQPADNLHFSLTSRLEPLGFAVEIRSSSTMWATDGWSGRAI